MRDHKMKPTDRPPRVCPTCGDTLGEHPYYNLRPGRSARFLRGLAAGLLPVMGILVFASLIVGGFWALHVASGYFFVALVCAPSLMLYSISRLLPKERRVLCLRCSWYQDYPDYRLSASEAL